jgi:cytochrome c-type biogenesis protein CcmH/NrfF
MRGKHPMQVITAALAFVPVALIVIGILHIIERWRHVSLEQWIELSVAGIIALS